MIKELNGKIAYVNHSNSRRHKIITARNRRKVECVVKIIGEEKDLWYYGLKGKPMKVFLYNCDRRAESKSLNGFWLEDEHFKVIKGKDPRPIKKD